MVKHESLPHAPSFITEARREQTAKRKSVSSPSGRSDPNRSLAVLEADSSQQATDHLRMAPAEISSRTPAHSNKSGTEAMPLNSGDQHANMGSCVDEEMVPPSGNRAPEEAHQHNSLLQGPSLDLSRELFHFFKSYRDHSRELYGQLKKPT